MAKPMVHSTPTDRHSAAMDILCPECDYNLAGATGDRCPWCGWAINVDALLHRGTESASGRRLAVMIAAAILGIGSFIVMARMTTRGRELNLFDGLTVMGVVLATAGHLMIACLAILAGSRFPIRNRMAADIALWLVAFSLISALAGAGRFLSPVGEEPRLVRGVTVNNAFEFVLAAVFFTLPAWALLILRLVSFREPSVSISNAAQAWNDAQRFSLARAPFLVEFFGPLTSDEVGHDWSDEKRSRSPAVERAIEQAWQTEIAIAEASNRKLIDAPLARLVRHVRGEFGVRLALGPTTYREYVGTHVHNVAVVSRAGTPMFADALGVSAILVTSDGWLSLGRRSGQVLHYPGFVHTIGGMVETGGAGAPSVFDAVLRELREELSLDQASVQRIVLLGLVRDRSLYQPELVFEVVTGCDRAALSEGAVRASHGREHDGLEALPDDPGRVFPALDRLECVTPVAQAAILLYGRVAWGTTWYEQACQLLYGELPRVQRPPIR
jgi:8-oxo-dGTP pyrophosphatase MutT (NUDIX family)